MASKSNEYQEYFLGV